MTKHILEFAFAVMLLAIAVSLAVDLFRPYVPYVAIAVLIAACVGGGWFFARRFIFRHHW